MTRLLAAGLLAFVVPLSALANAVVTSARGDVRAGTIPVTMNQRITPGTTVTTGPDSQVVMRFDDGQNVVLHQNTEFRVVDFRYSEAAPQQDRSIFDLLRGAARLVTGVIGRRSQAATQIRAPQATIGVRGTDFMLAIVNPLYISVLEGAVAASNAAGTVVFPAGSLGSIATSSALATSISAAALPAQAATAFSSLQSVVISGVATTTAGTAVGAGPATGGIAGLGTAATLAIIAAAVIAVAAATDDDAPTAVVHH